MDPKSNPNPHPRTQAEVEAWAEAEESRIEHKFAQLDQRAWQRYWEWAKSLSKQETASPKEV